jgi:pyruvate formate lyase activating enzyme
MEDHSARYENYIQCLLCPHLCRIKKGKNGICGVRKNTGEKIELLSYGVISGYSFDPVEKKPLYHFFPGHNILSMGSYGCNMRCDFCQNYHISQNIPESLKTEKAPDDILRDAGRGENNIGIAFTYNEPVIWFEYVMDVARLFKKEGLSTVMVSNGYINSSPLDELIEVIDSFNIDLKAFNNSFYTRLTGAAIEPVKRNLQRISRSGRHLEITTLIIPGKNDDEKEMAEQCNWIADELGENTPLHLSRYYPMFRRSDPATSLKALENLFNIASSKLKFVYLGNTAMNTGQNTYCPRCGTEVTKRSGYRITHLNLDGTGKCKNCGTTVYSHFSLTYPKSN